MRRYGRRDANHSEIAEAFRKLGCSWLDLASMGEGCPDGCVGFAGVSMLVEVKDGSKVPSKRALTKPQRDFRDDWKGGMRIVENLGDVAETVALLRRWQQRLSA